MWFSHRAKRRCKIDDLSLCIVNDGDQSSAESWCESNPERSTPPTTQHKYPGGRLFGYEPLLSSLREPAEYSIEESVARSTCAYFKKVCKSTFFLLSRMVCILMAASSGRFGESSMFGVSSFQLSSLALTSLLTRQSQLFSFNRIVKDIWIIFLRELNYNLLFKCISRPVN